MTDSIHKPNCAECAAYARFVHAVEDRPETFGDLCDPGMPMAEYAATDMLARAYLALWAIDHSLDDPPWDAERPDYPRTYRQRAWNVARYDEVRGDVPVLRYHYDPLPWETRWIRLLDLYTQRIADAESARARREQDAREHAEALESLVRHTAYTIDHGFRTATEAAEYEAHVREHLARKYNKD